MLCIDLYSFLISVIQLVYITPISDLCLESIISKAFKREVLIACASLGPLSPFVSVNYLTDHYFIIEQLYSDS